jgi:hypothetical protein
MEVKPCVIEFQAFRGNDDRFIIKELVILDLLTQAAFTFLFEAPCSVRELCAKAKITNRWITNHFHHIYWYEGFVPYNNVHKIMFHFCKQFTHIYTRGLEKKRWIQQYTNNEVSDVKLDKTFQFDCKNICVLTIDEKHRQTQCALQNAHYLASYLQQQQTEECGGVFGGDKSEETTDPEHHSYFTLSTDNIYSSEDGISTVSSIFS